MSKRLLSFIAVIAALSFASCTREKDPDFGPDQSRGYYPLNKGHYVVYDVDSVIWDDFTADSTHTHCQVRYTITDTFRDAQKRISYQVDVVKRNSATESWATNDVLFVTPTDMGLDVIQNNLRMQKLSFPAWNTKTWKGNSQIATADQDLAYFADWDYRYSHIGEAYNNSRELFENSIIVDQVDYKLNDPVTIPTAYAERTYGREVYSLAVGMVYREAVRWVYDQNSSTGQYARKGWEVIMRATDHN
jgi:hypothetical protein